MSWLNWNPLHPIFIYISKMEISESGFYHNRDSLKFCWRHLDIRLDMMQSQFIFTHIISFKLLIKTFKTIFPEKKKNDPRPPKKKKNFSPIVELTLKLTENNRKINRLKEISLPNLNIYYIYFLYYTIIRRMWCRII